MIVEEQRVNVPGISDAEFHALCEPYEDYRIEYTAEGELIVMPPTDPETGGRNNEIGRQLGNWFIGTKRRGLATDSSAGYKLPNGARRSPDAAWISRERLRRGEVPEFVVELISPSDRPNRIHAKMLEWIENGVLLGWMLNPRTRTLRSSGPAKSQKPAWASTASRAKVRWRGSSSNSRASGIRCNAGYFTPSASNAR